MSLVIIPAVDVLNGEAVRLQRGDPSRKTVFSRDPVEVAREWWRQGAERLHVVDLGGSLAGAPKNRDILVAIVKAVPIPVQLGGGIRGPETAEYYLEAGADRIVLGTLAAERRELVAEACAKWPGRVAVAIDARGRWVTVRGWTETTPLAAAELAKRLEGMGVSAIIYTDVERDGMTRGINLEATRLVARSVKIPVIASGGVAGLDDIRALMGCTAEGVAGVIVGKALYAGAIHLKEALNLTRGKG